MDSGNVSLKVEKGEITESTNFREEETSVSHVDKASEETNKYKKKNLIFKIIINLVYIHTNIEGNQIISQSKIKL